VDEKLHAALDIVRVIEAAHLINSAPSRKEGQARKGIAYHTLAAKVSAFGREFVTTVSLSLKSPIDVDTVRVAMYGPVGQNYSFEQSVERGRVVTEDLKEQGFDGVDIGGEELLVFAPEQVKSAVGNRGTFSNTAPDILASPLNLR